MTGEWLSRIERHLWPQGFGRNVWMIVDAARDERIFSLLRILHLEHYCLYSGPLPLALQAAAPYLVQLDHDDREMRQFLRHAWGNSWGVLLKCGTHAETLRHHLRRLLLVRDPRGNQLVFRYYDPRVLRVYLPTCTPDELRELFGPIEQFWIEDHDPTTVLDYSLHAGALANRRFSLTRLEAD